MDLTKRKHKGDEYLYLAHKFIGKVSKFRKYSNVIFKCSTYIQANQIKSAPVHNLSHHVIHMGQGLSIDFAFSGIMSKSKKIG